MAEGGEDYYSTSDSDTDGSLFDSNDNDSDDDDDDVEEDSSEDDDAEDLSDSEEEIQLEDQDEGQSNDEEEEQFTEELELLNESAKPEEPPDDGDNKEEKPLTPPRNIFKNMRFVTKCFYGHGVSPRLINILTDFVDAEIFLIDGDSLLLELLDEKSLDWSHGGQFLHLTYFMERFLQYFTDKGGVFHIVFFKEMETIWRSQPSMLLARQALILHLRYNTPFTVVTSVVNFWGQQWKDYVNDKVPAFLLLTDAENIPWKNERLKHTVEFFFRCLLFHCLAQGLNCAFISGIQMTATKVMGFYIESSAIHKMYFKKWEQPIWRTWQFLMKFWYYRASNSNLWLVSETFPPGTQIDVKVEVRKVLQSTPQGCCRQLATVLACAQILFKVLKDPNTSKQTIKTTEDRLKLFLLHTVLVKKLPLKYRAHLINKTLLDEFCKTKDDNVYPFDEIHTCLWEILKTIQVVQREESKDETGNNLLDMSSVADLMDGRLVHTLFFVVLEQRSKGLKGLSLPDEWISEIEDVWKKVVAVVNASHLFDSLEAQFFPFAEDVTGFHTVEEPSEPDSTVKLRRLLEVESALVKEYAGNIRSEINAMAGEKSDDEVFDIGREFDERYHWHSLKPLSDDYDRTKQTITDNPPDNPWQRKRYFREKLKYICFQRFYGNSLLGGIDQPKIITVTETGSKKQKGKSKEGKKSKKAAKIIEENDQKSKEKVQMKDQEKWQHIVKDIESNVQRGNFSDGLKLVDKYLLDCKSPGLRLQALMKKAESCFDAWKQTRTADPKSNDMRYPVLLMESVQKIAQDLQSLLTDRNKKKLARMMQKLGFDDVVPLFYALHPERETKLSVHTTSARFQLEYMGHLLKRNERTDPDSRVENFIPDTWQRELLDAVDNSESAVIVAPTSSGKTYASYYCMEKVLRQDNDSVVVYVAPTKALVNQVVATIYARFEKKMPKGRAVYGVFTRDYRYNALNCQILVTVPQCLEILFVSPHRQHWTKNVKYVIFDEVHCIGSETGAEVWEHLLLLIRCPFLALSATIGNPDDLRRWLQAAQDFREKQDRQDSRKLRKSYRIRLVKCDERYSDLEKSIYLPSPNNGGYSKRTGKYENDYDVKSKEEFVRLHPCAQLGFKQLRENGFPGDMALTPRETLQLYDVMVKQWPDNESLQQLCPEKYFLENKLIEKSHARQYESRLKKEFKSWADSKQSTKVQSVIQSLNSVCLKTQSSIDEEWGEQGLTSFGKTFIKINFPKLVDQLREQDKLPALVFSDDRKLCENLAVGVAKKLENKEVVMRAKDRPRNLKHAQKRQETAEKRLKRTRDESQKEKEKRVKNQPDEQDERDASALNEPLPECTLAFTYGIGKKDLDNIMNRIWFISDKSLFKRALKRGVSYHHGGCNAKKRSCVEMLFRKKYLQVVNATATLALGIHMPCKTVVFAGDSPYLNSLQYRQMSGRAGRRGFDPVGNVVFFGVPYRKVQRLITANIPKLVGNFPINVSLVLRLLLMTSKGDDRKDALTKALALLSHPFICRKHPEMESQIKKHFLFSVELLTRLGLINKENGAPQEMAGLATHLHYHEPSNYVLVRFLQRGLFHKLCQPGTNDTFSEDVMRKMVLVLSHLFGRRFIHSSLMRRISSRSTSRVILEALPGEFAEALKDYNRQVTDIFSQYLAIVARGLEKERGEENKLPISGIEFPDKASIGHLGKHDTIKRLANTCISYSACSSFAALSGNTDLQLHSSQTPAEAQKSEERIVIDGEKNSTEDGQNVKRREEGKSLHKESEDEVQRNDEDDKEEPIDHLLKIVRQDVYTDMNVVPILPVRSVQHLNAYALDFFKHGSSKVIENENGIRAGEVFNVLKDFYLTIKSISCSLEELGPESDNVVLAFKQLAQEYGQKFKKQFNKDI